MTITTIGIDLAKSVFQVHGVDRVGKVIAYFAQLPSCIIGMEACGGSHYLARKLTDIGHKVKLMAPQFVKPYVKAKQDLPGIFVELLKRLHTHLLDLDEQVNDLEVQITQWHNNNENSQKLCNIPGIGPLTATALVTSIADANCFRNGRELAAWMGLVPRQHSSGGKPLLLGISKRGDAYLRTLMIHGARSVVRVAKNKTSPTDKWTSDMLNRRHQNIASVARANKNARIVWALLAHGRDYNADYQLAA